MQMKVTSLKMKMVRLVGMYSNVHVHSSQYCPPCVQNRTYFK